MHPRYYLVCFILPISTTLFFLTAPHSLSGALVWTLPCWLVLLADWFSPEMTHGNSDAQRLNAMYFDWILYGLAGLQLGNLLLMLHTISMLSWQTSAEVATGIAVCIVTRFLVGTCSGISGVVVAHELMHRTSPAMQMLGRTVLCSICFLHFESVHKQAHHLGVGLQEDYTTARLRESFKAYWRRVYFNQLRYAWQMENNRLKGAALPYLWLNNRIVQGLLLEALMILLVFSCFGWVATGLFLYQAFIAVRIIESINYVQHWGLCDERYAHSFGWVSNGWFTHYLLLGLANHIGHHQHEHKPYYDIPYSDQGPTLPYGYLIMNLWAKLHNSSYQQRALLALEDYRVRVMSR